MITDGKQTTDKGPHEDLAIASEKLKEMGVKIFALGIGKDVEISELALVASRLENVFESESFDILLNDVAGIRKNICGKYILIPYSHQRLNMF